MILYPKAQMTAQRELDAAIGQNWLLSFKDHSSLVYVEVLCKEVLHWPPLMITAIPHCLMQDVIIGQYSMLADTMVIGNSWSIVHYY
jgi:cytochrome P450